MFQELRVSLTLLIFFTLLTGIVYPLLMTEIGQSLFAYQANGSLVEQNGKIIGSQLIGQKFSDDRYFHPRPSAAGTGYDAENSAASNLSPSAPSLSKTISARVSALRDADGAASIPIDLVTASASGLDPDISVAAANFQAARVAQARDIPWQRVQTLITQETQPRLFGALGESHINVLEINRALDALPPVTQ